MNEDSGRVIEAGVEVGLERGYVLCEVDPAVDIVTCVQEAYIGRKINKSSSHRKKC